MVPPRRPRRFAPLDPGKRVEGDERPVLKGVVFDVDGTLCLPQTYMFAEMRAALSIQKPTDILDHIYSLPEPEQEIAQEKIRQIERTAMTTQVPQPGLVDLMTYLDTHALPKGICTRNFAAPVSHLLTNFLPNSIFSPIITREYRPPKPDPAGILHISRTWMHESPHGPGGEIDVIMVGDSIDDMTAGYRAGAATVLLRNEVNGELVEHEHTDLVIERLDELVGILEEGFVGRA
ncbi:HAD-like domain-containing protein [Dendryphion nanum]|uniref:HAD-like domain-containing protein n=1 Tax=Dendryphion nanum TaxID=256645 RepID=A0A9P9EEG7_9PLEO|nr:HAD-like domain-containing protein [Dendryphion nanum]